MQSLHAKLQAEFSSHWLCPYHPVRWSGLDGLYCFNYFGHYFSQASWTCCVWYSYNSHHMWPLPLELWPPDKNLAFCTSLASWKCLHIDKENRRELPPWLQFPDKLGEQSSVLTQGFPQGWKNKSKCTYGMHWHSWKTGSTCGCWACNSL